MVARRQRQKKTAHAAGGTVNSDQSPVLPPSVVDYYTLFNRAPDAILIMDKNGHYIDANQVACKLTGYTREELLTMKIGDLTMASDRNHSAQRFEVLRKAGQSRADRILVRKDGTRLHIDAHAISLGNGTYQAILRDISKRVASREKLQQSLNAYSTLVDLCHAAVIAGGSDGRILSWNPGAEELFGYTAAEAIGQPIISLIPRRLRSKHLSMFGRHAELPCTMPFMRTLYTEGLRKDGAEVPVEVSVGVGCQGKKPIFTAVIRDVSEQREMVEQLNDALQQLQFHVERMPLGYIVWDVNFRVQEWNRAAEYLFGYAKAEAVGRHAYDLIIPPDVVPTIDPVWSDLLKGDTSSHMINMNRRKDGSLLTCEWFNTSLRDSKGRIRGVASMTMDVSEREELELRIRDAQKVESLGIMAGGIAHDFNSSLMVILGNTALLRSTKRLPRKAIEHLELIEEAGSRADELIKHLLAYARTGRHNPHPINLNDVIQETVKLVRSSLGPRHVLDIKPAGSLKTIIADRSQIEQIVLNLCLNAKQAMSGGGTITLTTRDIMLTPTRARQCVPFDARPAEYVEMTVEDTGCGMDPATIGRMFDPFFTTKADGHGLGMAAVLGILRQHGAAIQVESKPGTGSRIHIFFPVVGEAGTGSLTLRNPTP